jgi:hypothetical protein
MNYWYGLLIGIFIGESLPKELSPQDLRRILGEDAILASVTHAGDGFWDWCENHFSLDELTPVDRDLPFRR